MILTGPEIKKRVEGGDIQIEPFDPSLAGPNSVDLRLGDKLLVYEAGKERIDDLEWAVRVQENLSVNKTIDGNRSPIRYPTIDMMGSNSTHDLLIDKSGIVLWPGVLYLGRTIETVGSDNFVPIIEGRSSVGRLGIHVHVTAGFCDLGFKGTITLEIHVIHPVVVYPNVPICQAYFLRPEGEIELYKGRYQNQVDPVPSRFAQKNTDDA